jgi:hypothetical protein
MKIQHNACFCGAAGPSPRRACTPVHDNNCGNYPHAKRDIADESLPLRQGVGVSLLPGEERIVAIRFRTDSLKSGMSVAGPWNPRAAPGGWNIASSTLLAR